MADPFLGEIKLVPFNFAPRGWALCAGQLMSIAQNTALFSLLGTQYGGNGQITFGLPDLQSRALMSRGQGPGLTDYVQGEMGGVESVSLTPTQLPSHAHDLKVNGSASSENNPAGHYLGKSTVNGYLPYGTGPNGAMPASSVSQSGNGLPHDNLQPYLVLNYIIALQGIYPSRP